MSNLIGVEKWQVDDKVRCRMYRKLLESYIHTDLWKKYRVINFQYKFFQLLKLFNKRKFFVSI